MRGGVITDNEADMGGGVYVNSYTGVVTTFTMTGGEITGNTATQENWPANDVYVHWHMQNTSGKFYLSGAAIIGEVLLLAPDSNDSYAPAVINLPATFTGQVGALHLASRRVNVNNVINYWTDRQAVVPATAVAFDPDTITLGRFIYNGATVTNISTGYELDSDGYLRAK